MTRRYLRLVLLPLLRIWHRFVRFLDGEGDGPLNGKAW